MNKSRKEKPNKNSSFFEIIKSRRNSRIQNQNEDDDIPKSAPLIMSTPKRSNKCKPFSEISQDSSKFRSNMSLNSSQKRYHKNYDPDIEIRQVNERITKRNSCSWADQSILNDEQEVDLIKYSEKMKKIQRNVKLEEDVEVLARRQNDIDKGKSKECYKNYVYEVAKEHRKQFQPKTPNKFMKMSRRGWDGLVRKWKKHIHAWNEPKFEELYAAGVEMDCCNSDVASIASFKDILSDLDTEENKDSVKDIFSEQEEETLQGSKATRKRTFSSNINPGDFENDIDEETLENVPLKNTTTSKLVDLHTGLTNDAALMSVNVVPSKRLKMSDTKLKL